MYQTPPELALAMHEASMHRFDVAMQLAKVREQASAPYRRAMDLASAQRLDLALKLSEVRARAAEPARRAMADRSRKSFEIHRALAGQSERTC